MTHMSRILLIITMSLTLGWLLRCQAADPVAAPAPTPKIGQVTVIGMDHVKEALTDDKVPVIDAINAKANTLVNKAYDKDAVEKVRADIETSGWFFSVEVAVIPVSDTVEDLKFTVKENSYINHVEFEGNVTYSSAKLRELLSMPGGVLNPQRFQKDYRAINAFYAKNGYTATEVIDHRLDKDTKHPGDQYVLVYVILEPHISEIVISGTKHTHNYVVLHQLVFKVGDIFNENDINRSVINLDGLGIFQGVTYNAEAGTTEPGSIMVTIVVTEQSTGNASFGIAESSAAGLTGFVTITETNLFGTGRSLSLSLTIGGEKSYDLEYKIPYLDKHRTSLEIGIYDRITIRQAEANSSVEQDFASHDAGMNVVVSRPLNWKSNTRLCLALSADDLRGTLTGNAAVLPPSVLIPILKQSNVRSISPSIVRDVRMGNPLRPFGGSLYTLGAQCAGLWGGVHFNKIYANASWYFIVKRDPKATEKAGTNVQPAHWIYATRVMAGTSTGVPPFLDQYMVGGGTTVRGYKEQRFPGENMVIFNNELRVPVANIVDLVGFVDIGDAWGGSFADSLGDANFHLHGGYGAGIRVNAPIIGPIRLDLGFDAQGHSELYFGVGSTF